MAITLLLNNGFMSPNILSVYFPTLVNPQPPPPQPPPHRGRKEVPETQKTEGKVSRFTRPLPKSMAVKKQQAVVACGEPTVWLGEAAGQLSQPLQGGTLLC